MTSKDFFEFVSTQYKKQLPFVVYRKPNREDVKAMLQKTDDLYLIEDFTQRGFVFSPFDDIEPSILIPKEHSEIIAVSSVPTVDVEARELKPSSEENGKENHVNLVKKGIEAISEDKFKKVVLSRKETVQLKENNPIEIFKRLLSSYKSAFVYCWYHPKIGIWLGATPETLIKIEGSQFSIMALAGTQKYEGSLNVLWQEKEKQEQQYVTDFILENLKPSVESLKVSDVETVKAGNLVHLRTMISAQLKKGIPLKEVIDALHPTPAVCGLPKDVAKQFILKHENYHRGFYTGYLGELNLDKSIKPRSGRRNIENRAYAFSKQSTQLYVNLRCMQIQDNHAIIYVGGGITKSSNPEKEWDETEAKSLVIKNVL
ncbi:chorismate-binding protein [Flavobacteriaceae bacterium SZ-1-7]|uniref:chorismate-binding protein n=1 Tax=Tamlana sedimenti TaxID=3134126 RepID=UPI0031217222